MDGPLIDYIFYFGVLVMLMFGLFYILVKL